MRRIKSQNLLFVTFGIVSFLSLSFKVKAQNVSVDLKRGNVDQNLEKVIDSDKINLKQELKELTTEQKKQLFLGKWNISFTSQDNESNLILEINGFSIYKANKTMYGKYKMKMVDNLTNEIFAIITVKSESSWSVNQNILTEKIKSFKIMNVQSYNPNIQSNELKALFQEGLEQDIGKPFYFEILNLSQERIILKDLENNEVFTLIREE